MENNDMNVLRKSLKKVLIINWARFSMEEIAVDGSLLITGQNRIGKSTILDALIYVLTGSTKFNSSADDGSRSDRSVRSYVRGDTKSEGDRRYIRDKNETVISYIVMEFYSPQDNCNITAGVCIESYNVVDDPVSYWFVVKDASISDFNFCNDEGIVTAKNELCVKGIAIKSSSFIADRARGPRQVLSFLGVHVDNIRLFRQKLLGLVSFSKEGDVNNFIQNSVLPEVKIDTISQLRDMKDRYEEWQRKLNDIKAQQEILGSIEEKTREFEKKYDEFIYKQAEYYWQDYIIKRTTRDKNIQNIKDNEDSLHRFNVDYEKLENDYDMAKRIRDDANIAYRSSDGAMAIENLKGQIRDIEDKIKKADREKSEINDLKLEIKKVSSYLELTPDESSFLNTLDLNEGVCDDKYVFYRNIKSKISDKLSALRDENSSLSNEEKDLRKQVSEYADRINKQKNGITDFPPFVSEAKNRLNNELKKRGIDTEVRIFAELVEDITNYEWLSAIEFYLGNRRFNLIPDKQYSSMVTTIFHELNISGVQCIMTHKLPNNNAEDGSAADLLTIHNPSARAYGDFLLGRLHLCCDIDDLKEHPKGGIMKDGTATGSYALGNKNRKHVDDYYLGHEAKRLQLERNENEYKRLSDQLTDVRMKKTELEKNIYFLESVNENVRPVTFESIDNYDIFVKQREDILNQLALLEVRPELEILRKQFELAESKLNDIVANKNFVYSNIKQCEAAISEGKAHIVEFEDAQRQSLQKFDDYILNDCSEDIRDRAIVGYDKDCISRSVMTPVNQGMLDTRRQAYMIASEKMTDEHRFYAQRYGMNINEVGPSFIYMFRELSDRLKNIEVEDTKDKLEKSRKEILDTFAYSFLSSLFENMNIVDRELDNINARLRDIGTFETESYVFVKNPRSDKRLFFDIKKQWKRNFDSSGNIDADVNINDNDIEEALDMVLQSDDDEYIDYRNYYTYNIRITDHSDNNRTIMVSEQDTIASGAEKKMPYYIILAASLNNFYLPNVSCARLVFIDEAFGLFSPPRQERMAKYFDENGFQMIYVAQEDKINTIGRHVNSICTVLRKGQYSTVIEGLVGDYVKKSAETGIADSLE